MSKNPSTSPDLPTNPPAAEIPSAWKIASDPTVVSRAAIMAAIVGTVLVSINHGMCFWSGNFGSTCMIQSILTFMVPYAVSTISSVQATRCRAKKNR